MSIGLIVPGWLWARKRHPQGPWLLGLPVAGIVAWVILAVLGIGAQSLSNVVETVFIVTAAIGTAYIKFLVIDRVDRFRAYGTAAAYAVVVGFAVVLRLAMPLLPE